ncbi:hypothetical protein M0805_005787 [Coniferiporia weirii]|nr:hypothetical protein M0805_005787 [Coniferiporia weirii]
MSPQQRIWFITGTSTGLGREFVHAVLARNPNDRVIATARSLSQIQDLAEQYNKHETRCYTLRLDLNDDYDAMRSIAAEAMSVWGRVDVLVNNAGRGTLGISEEAGVEGYRTQFATGFFGTLSITHAFLPYFRGSRAGTVVFIGSRSGWREVVHAGGTYASCKAALAAAAEGLAAELAPFGIRVLNVVPGALRTQNWAKMAVHPPAHSALLPPLYSPQGSGGADSPGKIRDGQHGIADYDSARERMMAWLAGTQTSMQHGDPAACARAVVSVVCGEAQPRPGSVGYEKGWPDLNLLILGSDAEANIRDKYERVLRNMIDWNDMLRCVDSPAKSKL